MRKSAFLLTLLLAALIRLPAGADSLWQPNSESAFADRKAHRAGDLLTVLIAESSSTKHSAETDSAKKTEGKAEAGTGLFDFIRSFSLSGERTSSGSGSSAQSTKLVDRVTVTVVEVLPSGLLRIQGERLVSLHAEKLKLTLSGLVRKEDIAPDNTVLSSQVADLCIDSGGKGPTTDTQRPGLIYRLIRLLF